MTIPFGDLYSKYYDLIYLDKDYEGECDYLESLLKRYEKTKTKTILELGAGTGAYSIPFAARGYSVHATDISPSMIKIAKAKARKKKVGGSLSFEVSDMREIRSRATFDACLCIFAAINYLPSIEDIEKTCKNAWKHLHPKGLFVFDFWNGDAVISLGPTQRFKVVESGKTTLIRLANPTLDVKKKFCTIHFRTFVMEGGALKHEFSEEHRMRYLFPGEVKRILANSGFRLVSLHPFLHPGRRASSKDWNLTAVAAKR